MIYIFLLAPLLIGCLFFLKPRNCYLKWGLILIRTLSLATFLLLTCRVYWFDIYKIPSESMEQTLHVGDKIVIRKDALPKRNDIVVFKSMNVDDLILVKRCVGLPGDTLSIKQNTVFVNGKALDEPLSLQWSYAYAVIDLDSIQLAINRSINASNASLLLTASEAKFINEKYPSYHLKRNSKRYGEAQKVFPRNKRLSNNRDNFDAFVVPSKGLTVKLDSISVLWYRKYIKLECDKVRIDQEGRITHKGETSHFYTFKNDYFYMMGDNRHRSVDSRFFGFVSELNIKGKVIMIW